MSIAIHVMGQEHEIEDFQDEIFKCETLMPSEGFSYFKSYFQRLHGSLFRTPVPNPVHKTQGSTLNAIRHKRSHSCRVNQ